MDGGFWWWVVVMRCGGGAVVGGVLEGGGGIRAWRRVVGETQRDGGELERSPACCALGHARPGPSICM